VGVVEARPIQSASASGSHYPLSILKVAPGLEEKHFNHFSVQCPLGLQQARLREP
jgi:hypothetical protein